MNQVFLNRYKNRKTSDIEYVINHPESYRPDAIETAKYILEERRNGNSDFAEPEILPPDESKPPLISRLNTSVKSVAVYQIISGLLASQYILSLQFNNLLNITFSISFLFIYASALIGGILLFKKNKKGFLLSKIFNAAQSATMAVSGFYYYSIGLFSFIVSLRLHSGIHFGFNFDFSPKMSFLFYDTSEFFFGLNIVAVVALYILIKAEDQLEEKGNFDDEFFTSNLLGEDHES